jgi:hypothetical protein
MSVKTGKSECHKTSVQVQWRLRDFRSLQLASEHLSLLRCHDVSTGKYLQAFRDIILSSFSWTRGKKISRAEKKITGIRAVTTTY